MGMHASFGIPELFRAALCEGFFESGVEIPALGGKHYAVGWQFEDTQTVLASALVRAMNMGRSAVQMEPGNQGVKGNETRAWER